MLSKAQMSADAVRKPSGLAFTEGLRLFSAIIYVFAAVLVGPVIAQEPPKRTLEVAAGTLAVETLTSGLSFPWSLEFLPNGDMLVSEKNPGRLRRVMMDGTIGSVIGGLPSIFAEAHGGLLGLAIDPDFETNQYIYFAYSELGEDGKSGLSVGRGRLRGDRLEEVETIWRQTKVKDVRNFGGRLAFAPDGRLFVMAGERFAWGQLQDPSNTLGVVARIEPDGSIPANNTNGPKH